MQLEFDPDVNALYLRIRSGRFSQTVELEEQVYLDLDADGQVLGVEFVDANDFFSLLERHHGQLEIPDQMTAALAG